MSTNDDYRRLYAREKELSRPRYAIVGPLQDEMNQAICDEYRRRHPRKKKLPDQQKMFVDLGEWGTETFELFKKRLVEQQKAMDDEIRRVKDERFALLAGVEFIPSAQECEIRTTNADTWSSQGFGANRYAEGALEYECALLNANGLPARIECQAHEPSVSPYGRAAQYNTYRLVARCEPWMAEALWLVKGDVKERDRFFWKHGLNAKVYNPWALNYGE